jgi:hypothetical protein
MMPGIEAQVKYVKLSRSFAGDYNLRLFNGTAFCTKPNTLFRRQRYTSKQARRRSQLYTPFRLLLICKPEFTSGNSNQERCIVELSRVVRFEYD